MRCVAVAWLGLLAATSIAFAAPPKTEQERETAIRALKWHEGRAVTLPISHAHLQAPATVQQLVGDDSGRLWEVLNAIDAPRGSEATLYDPATDTIVFYQKLGDGYIRLDDWQDVDADALLKSVTDNTEANNVKRKEAGLSPVHVVGWLERPQLDRATNTVRWSFEASDEKQGRLVNKIALILGRDGFEKLTWVGTKETGADLLAIAQSSFSFADGGRYTDFQSGDKVAEYGIAGLVAAVLGAKVAAKLGLLAVLAVFAKKVGVFLLLPIAFFFKKIKAFFSRGKPPPAVG
ncbi:MAG: DUF2167 domain-containing protein [Proteobacteria bacterium]|nr:DUF2167 domain-containing protein [Pseudomonadota bacterium]